MLGISLRPLVSSRAPVNEFGACRCGSRPVARLGLVFRRFSLSSMLQRTTTAARTCSVFLKLRTDEYMKFLALHPQIIIQLNSHVLSRWQRFQTIQNQTYFSGGQQKSVSSQTAYGLSWGSQILHVVAVSGNTSVRYGCFLVRFGLPSANLNPLGWFAFTYVLIITVCVWRIDDSTYKTDAHYLWSKWKMHCVTITHDVYGNSDT